MAEDQQLLLTDTCEVHSDKKIEYHCYIHKKLACYTCVMLNHRNCEIKYIPDISKGIATSPTGKVVSTELNELIQKLHDTKTMVMEDSRECRMVALQYRDEIVDHIDTLLVDVEDTNTAHVTQVLSPLHDIEKSANKQLAQMETVKSEISARKEDNCDNSLFILYMTAGSLIEECQKTISTVETASNVASFEFGRNVNAFDVMKGVKTLGDVNPFVNTFKTSAHLDKGTCQITGSHILKDGRLILTDCNNKAIKLFGMDHKLQTRIRLPSAPLGIAGVGEDEIIVTIRDNKKMLYFTASDKLTPGRGIQTEYPYYDVTHCDNKLAVTETILYMNAVVHILDMDGRILRVLGSSVRTFNGNIKFHPDNKMLYVTSRGEDTNCVYCMTMDGDVICEYKSRELIGPWGLTIHPDGSVYICGEVSNNIHHVTADCQKIDILHNGGELVRPAAICINKAGNRLYVADLDSDVMKVFKLRQTRTETSE